MKRFVFMLTVLLVITLSGCDDGEKNTREIIFANYTNFGFTATEYTYEDGTSLEVLKGYYFPEVGTACFDVEVMGMDEDDLYTTSFNHSGENISSYSDYVGTDPDEEGFVRLCHDKLEYGSYDVSFKKESGMFNNEQKLLEIEYEDLDYSATNRLDIVLDKFETADIYPFDLPNVTVNGGLEYGQGDVVIRLFDQFSGKDVYRYSKEVSNLPFYHYYGDPERQSVEYVTEPYYFGLYPNHTYGVSLLYDPLRNGEILIPLDSFYFTTNDIELADLGCFSHFVCASVRHKVEVGAFTDFTLFVKNDPEFINEQTGEPHVLSINFYDDRNELLYSEVLTQWQEELIIPTYLIEDYEYYAITVDIKEDISIEGPPEYIDSIVSTGTRE